MAFDPVLMIMQPRQIDESINSLKHNIDEYDVIEETARYTQLLKDHGF